MFACEWARSALYARDIIIYLRYVAILYVLGLKDKKRLRFRVVHLIEFIQSNNFHIYLIFYR